MEDKQDPDFSEDEVHKILRDALKVKLEEKRKDFPQRVQLQKALTSVVGEFLTTFRIVGYDYEGQLVSLSCHKDPMTKAALDNAFIQEFTKFMSNRNSSQSI